ncbi:hypothetical protein [Phyllobacterium zundukense]|uniref:Uncharacterized protein n=1 Tax=Phyllobacterium zundukense TaxID=1867719 RepID=A0ACD4D701_9HYPH|nr:hypothetical protein [Phyllobacterium zundukense]UXN61576.1 hypothetical protein N8E88_16075 [Phyllobacterium zundukense]
MTTTDKPGSLETKFKLLQMLPYDPRAKRKHILVYGFILDWYHSKYGDALASVRHIVGITKERDPSERGLYAGDIHKALTDLVTWGYLDQQKGSGRKASRYVPIWEKLASVRKIPNTTEDEASVRENTNTCVLENTYTTDDSVRDSANEDPSTPTRVPDPETGVDMDACVPPVAGLVPATANARKEDSAFHTLWLAYGVKKSLAEAEAEFAKRTWDMEALLAAATAWRDAWKAQNNPDAPRKRLHVWLRDRHYLEDPPSAYVKKEREPKPAKKKPAVADNDDLPMTPASEWDVGPFSPFGTFNAQIVGSEVTTLDPHNEQVVLTIELGGVQGNTVDHTFLVQSSDQAKQERGQQFLFDVMRAVGFEGTLNDTCSLHYTPLSVTIDRGIISYAPLKEAA